MPGDQPINIGSLSQLTRLGSKSPFLPKIAELTWQPVIVMGQLGQLQSDPFEARGYASCEISPTGTNHATVELAAFGPGGTVIESITTNAIGIGANAKLLIRLAETPRVAGEPGTTQCNVLPIGGVAPRSQLWGQNDPTAFPDTSANDVKFLPSIPVGQGELNLSERRIFLPPASYFAVQLSDDGATLNIAIAWRELDEPV
jgi:hypothetical protein